MAQTQAHIKATNKYIAKAYDRVNLTLPKGQREVIREYAEAHGMSLNGYINKLIAADMEQDQTGIQTEHQTEHKSESTAKPHNSEDYTIVIPKEKVEKYRKWAIKDNFFQSIEEAIILTIDEEIDWENNRKLKTVISNSE